LHHKQQVTPASESLPSKQDKEEGRPGRETVYYLKDERSFGGSGNTALYKWVIVLIGLAVLSVSYGLRWSFGLFCNPISEEFDCSRTSFSLAMSIHMLMFAFLSPLTGSATDRFGYKPILLSGTILLGSGFIILRFVDDIWSFYFIYGIFMATGSSGLGLAPNNLMVGNLFEKKGVPIGIASTGTSIGPFFIAPFATYLILSVGWRNAFTILGGMILIFLVPLIQLSVKQTAADQDVFRKNIQRECNPEEKPASKLYEMIAYFSIRNQQKGGNQINKMLFGYFACCLSYYLICFHLPGIFGEKNVPHMNVATVLGLTTLSGIFGKLILGAVSDKVGTEYPLVVCLLLEAFAIVGIMFSGSLAAFYVAGIFLGISFGGVNSLVPVHILNSQEKSFQGKVMGLLTFSGAIGGSIGPLIGGLSYDLMNSFLPGVTITVTLVILASTFLALRRKPVRAN